MFFCCLCYCGNGQSKKVKEAIKKQEQKKEDQTQASDEQYQKSLQHQFDIQSKATKKRMLENKKKTDKFYKKKQGQTLCQRLCAKKRKR